MKVSNVFNINRELKEDFCIYKYECGTWGRDEKSKSIYEIVMKYKYSVER